jgi:hypothetical protein
VKDKYTRLIVLDQGALSDAQITGALRVSDQTMWWRGLVQLIEESRNELAAAAAEWANEGNSLAMARANGGHQALSLLLLDLEKRRSSSG